MSSIRQRLCVGLSPVPDTANPKSVSMFFAIICLAIAGAMIIHPGDVSAAQEMAVDLTVRYVASETVEVAIYPTPRTAERYVVQLECSETGAVRTEQIQLDATVLIDGIDPDLTYTLTAYAYDRRGAVIGNSPIEKIARPAVAPPPLTASPQATLSVNIVNLDPQNFPFIFTTVDVDSDGVAPTFDPNDFTIYEDGRLQTDAFEVNCSGGEARIADIIFLVDNSGSMSAEQNDVRDNLAAFANGLAAAGIDFRLGLVRFGQGSGSGNPILVNGGSMTNDATDFINNYLNQFTVDGSREPGLQAIIDACQGYPFRAASQRHFLLITDEDSDGGILADAITCCQANGIEVHTAVRESFGSTVAHYSGPSSIRDATGGLLFDVIGPYSQVLDLIIQRINKRCVIRYRTDNQVCDTALREVIVQLTAFSETGLDTGYYRCGTNPTINRTTTTADLSASPQVEGVGLTFCAEVTDPFAPFVNNVRLYYRTSGQTTYLVLAMADQGGGTWCVDLPGGAVQQPGVDYYMTAGDGGVTVSDPSVDASLLPYQIAVLPNVAPAITHTPVTSASRDQDVPITATVVDNTNSLASVVLRYREFGDLVYTELPMTPGGGDVYEETIPGALVQPTDVEYEIRAVDNFGVGSSHGPHLIVVEDCLCPFQGDLDASGFRDAVDISLEINVVFFNGFDPQDPSCPTTRGDFNADGYSDAIDLALLIEHVFFGGLLPTDPCGNPNPECVGAGCGAFLPCNEPNNCLDPVCATLAEGGGVCLEGSTSCLGLQLCPGGSGDCPPGYVCAVGTCCVDPVCVPPSALCYQLPLMRAHPPLFTEGSTVGSRNR